ncbi:MAG: diaminopimelate epimerase, partial [Firmicutes bacterium]|nr:diaminopimelate epimerase [Bacillota bacterium]
MVTKIVFTKMHGCGNDYIFFDGADIQDPQSLAIKLTNRNKSIGGDGIVLVLPSETADAKMRMFNADGSEGLMCGSSIRCLGKYLFDHGICKKLQMEIETASGMKKISLEETDGIITDVQVDMGPAILHPKKIPVALTGEMAVARKVNIGGNFYEITCLSMGNPHAIIFNDDIDHFDLQAVGSAFEASELFPEGINLGVVQMINRRHIRMRVWERGTGETMASGTGACAAAVAA